MTLASLLSPDQVVAEMQSQEQMPAIDELVAHLVQSGTLDSSAEEPAKLALHKREEQRSTGIGNGVAIPHCTLEDVDRVVAIFGRSHSGIEFCALDRSPVHLVVLFIVPPSQYGNHLKTLAAIAKILNVAETREKLRNADGAEGILEILSQKSAGK